MKLSTISEGIDRLFSNMRIPLFKSIVDVLSNPIDFGKRDIEVLCYLAGCKSSFLKKSLNRREDERKANILALIKRKLLTPEQIADAFNISVSEVNAIADML